MVLKTIFQVALQAWHLAIFLANFSDETYGFSNESYFYREMLFDLQMAKHIYPLLTVLRTKQKITVPSLFQIYGITSLIFGKPGV